MWRHVDNGGKTMRRLLLTFLIPGLALAPGSVLAEDEGSTWTGAFVAAGETKIGRFGHAATALPDGRVLIVGGEADGGPTKRAELWDPESATFSAAGRMIKGRMFPAATVLDDGRVLIVGGHARIGTLSSAEAWDPHRRTFAPAGELRQARAGAEAVTLRDGRVVIVGGGDGATSIEVWQPKKGRFREAGELDRPLWGHTVTLLSDGRLLIIGGGKASHIWEPSTGAMVRSGSMQSPRSHHTATLLSDGRVLVVGGSTVDESIATAEVWDPSTRSFDPTGSMAGARSSHTASLLADDRVLIVGGHDQEGVSLASSEVWDPRTGRFTPAAPLAHARAQHSATSLPDGRVLVVGGTGFGPHVRAAEVWDPTAPYVPAVPPADLSLANCAGDGDDAPIAALLADFPAALEGSELEPVACHGRDWLALHDRSDPAGAATIERAEALLESQGRSIDDLYVAAALHEPESGRISTITALRVDGAAAARLVDAAIPLLLGIERPVKATRTVGESEIETIQVRDETLPGAYPTTFYSPLGDTLWIVTAHDRRLLGEIVEALPGPGGHLEVPGLGVAITFPDDWQVRSQPEQMGNPEFDLDAVQWSVAGGSQPDGGACSLLLFRPTEVTPLEAMRQMLADSEEEPPEPEILDDGMVRLAGPGSFLGGATDMAIYLKGADDAIALMYCMAEEAPSDLWSPIAESIELMPVDDTAILATPPEPTAEPTVLEE